MTIALPIVTYLAIVCIMLSSGASLTKATQAARYIRPDQLADVIKDLPLADDHSMEKHSMQEINAALLKIWLERKVCAPRRLYVGCYRNTRVIFTCKVSPTSDKWAWAVIGVPHGLGIENGKIITVYTKHEYELDSSAAKNGCYVPALEIP